jgi:lipid-A-disaccharide synthase
VHYVSPSVWAWREKRAEHIGHSADRVLCLFPMEPAIYARHGVAARFVGHPLAAAFALHPDKAAARQELGLPADDPVLALLPGSRLDEIKRLTPDFLAAAALLTREFPTLRIVAPMANAACREAFAAQLQTSAFGKGPTALSPQPSALPFLHTIDGNARTAMIAADAVLLASGTAALEAMLAKRAMAVAYRLAPLTYWLIQRLGLMRTQVYSLPNILAGKTLMPELMQDDCTPQALAAALAPALRVRELAPDLLAEFIRLHESLRGDSADAAAVAIADLITSI